ncbi:MAG TPA: DUF4430 domain-containing protein [Pseudobacteroides sp.]|uniref:DUF4430 domain-containing protein n=1 Tax=Pseudobacteroides sp. TaxID=1968840 RepID=UPI002F9365C9
MKKNAVKILITLIIAAVLVISFFEGGNAPGSGDVDETPKSSPFQLVAGSTNRPDTILNTDQISTVLPSNNTPNGSSKPLNTPLVKSITTPRTVLINRSMPSGEKGLLTSEEKLNLTAEIPKGTKESVEPGNIGYSQSKGMKIDSDTGKDKYLTNPVPKGKPIPVEPQNVNISDKIHTCTLTVRCDTILKNIKRLDPEKVELVPGDGVIFGKKEVAFYEGESVFNVLLREMKGNKIHMEFVNTPIYNSAYIEGIGNLYEFDCGELSGWMYKVNGWFPNYGCSRYQLKQGDAIEWVYTCDLGNDVGGHSAIGG